MVLLTALENTQEEQVWMKGIRDSGLRDVKFEEPNQHLSRDVEEAIVYTSLKFRGVIKTRDLNLGVLIK